MEPGFAGFDKVAVLGVGLIGASFAQALRKHSLSAGITGYGRTGQNLKEAQTRGIIDSYSLDAAGACDGADLVVLATPVGRFESLVKEISGALKPGTVVIDMGSVKGGLVGTLEWLMPEGVSYLGCHPIAGGESSGIGASRAELLEGALFIITPTAKTDQGVLTRMSGVFEAIGARVKVMSPEEHDRVYALVSHFPHVAAYAIINALGDGAEGALPYAGRGFKDTTRVAMSSPELWEGICMMNRENLVPVLERFKDNIELIIKHLKDEDREGLMGEFLKAQKLRGKVGD